MARGYAAADDDQLLHLLRLVRDIRFGSFVSAVDFDRFIPRFEYRPVAGVPTDRLIQGDSVIAFSVGTTNLDPRSGGAIPPGAHGIAIASASGFDAKFKK